LKSSRRNEGKRGPGRRRGETTTRPAILEAARGLFAERGYDRTTIRAVARTAGVDPALVLHFFGSKQELFLAVVELPFEPEAVAPALLADPDEAGARLAHFLLGVLEDPGGRDRVTGIVRAAASEPAAARLVRELIGRRVLGAIAGSLGSADADLRATLVGSQVVGLVMARYVVGVEPLASLPAEAVARAIAPNLQRYLTGPLDATA
jgi:AcrR family transcriptional regulator